MRFDPEGLLLTAGALLLGIAAFMGLAQASAPRGSATESRWRVVHSGGTAGGVQLLALSAVWPRLQTSRVLRQSSMLVDFSEEWIYRELLIGFFAHTNRPC